MIQRFKTKTHQVLTVLGKKVRLDLHYLVRGGFWLSIGQASTGLFSFLSSIAFANILSPDEYGTYRYILTVAAILTITSMGEINTSLTQAVARGFEGSLMKAFQVRTLWGLIGSVASVCMGAYYLLHHNYTIGSAFLIVSLFVFIFEPLTVYDGFLFGKKLFRESTKINTIQQIVATISVIAVLFFTKNPLATLIAYFVSWIVVRACSLVYVRNHFTMNTRVDPNMVSYGKKLTLISVISVIAGYFDRLLIFHLLGGAELALYTIATAPLEQLKGFIKMIYNLAFPNFSILPLTEIKKRIRKNIILFGFLLIILAIGYIACAPLLYHIFFKKYLAAIGFSQLFAFAIIPLALYLPLTALEAKQKTKELYQFNMYSSLVQIVLLVPCVYAGGIWGAIAARIAGRLFNLGFITILLKRSTD